jgi:hypothetical protein
MPSYLVRLIFIAIFFSNVSLVAASCDFDEFPMPDGVEPQWLMSNVVYNGVSLSVKIFQSETRLSSVREFYQRRWEGEYTESRIDEWLQIIHLEDGCIFQVQLGSSDTGSYGRLIMTPLDGENKRPPLGSGIDMPVDTLTLIDMSSVDDYKNSRTVVMSNARSGTENMTFFRTSMLRQGWVIEMQEHVAEGYVLTVKKKADRISIIITEQPNTTQILYNVEAID